MTFDHLFVEPLDVLVLRGNRLFGDSGSGAHCKVPPWPSVLAGALRSQILADAGGSWVKFAAGQQMHPELGTPTLPGPFRLMTLEMARHVDVDRIETLHPLPADLVRLPSQTDQTVNAVFMQPQPGHPSLDCSAPLSMWPVLPLAHRAKPQGGYWLTEAGWHRYLAGAVPDAPHHWVETHRLWKHEMRTSAGLNPERRGVARGLLYSTQTIALAHGVGFLVAVTGGTLPQEGVLRLGGEGRGAWFSTCVARQAPIDIERMLAQRRARLILTTPAILGNGWCPDGVADDGRWRSNGMKARLVCAAVPRGEVVGGWDMAHARPKAAERVAPAGSVYWLDELEATSDTLAHWMHHGLWPDGDGVDAQRQIEGFNRFTLAVW